MLSSVEPNASASHIRIGVFARHKDGDKRRRQRAQSRWSVRTKEEERALTTTAPVLAVLNCERADAIRSSFCLYLCVLRV